MYPTPLGSSFVVSQKISGTGQFNGTDYGRAKATLPHASPNGVVRVASRVYGAGANALSVEYVDRGVSNVVAATVVEQVGPATRVILRRAALGSPLATAAEVAAAINAFTIPRAYPLGAVYGGDGTGVVAALAPTLLAGGVNPLGLSENQAWSAVLTYGYGANVEQYGVLYRSIQAANTNHTPDTSPTWWEAIERTSGSVFRWDLPANSHAGLFTFENRENLVIHQFEVSFTIGAGTHWVRLSRVPLNEAQEAISAEAGESLYFGGLTTAVPRFTFGDLNLVVPPNWGLQVDTNVALPGWARLDVVRGVTYPVF